MTDNDRPANPAPSHDNGKEPQSTTVPADEIGVSLTISDAALEKIEQIKEEAVEVAKTVQEFAWR